MAMFFPTMGPAKPTMKVRFGDDVRRLPIELPEGTTQEEAFRITHGTVVRTFGLSSAQAETLLLQYLDDENDTCTLTDVSMEDLACLAAGAIWKLTAVLGDAPAATSASAPHAGATPVVPPTDAAPPGVELEAQEKLAEIPGGAIHHALDEDDEEEAEIAVCDGLLFEPPPRRPETMAEAVGLAPAENEPEAEVVAEKGSTVLEDGAGSTGDASSITNFDAAAATSSVAAAASGFAQPGWKRVMKSVMGKRIWKSDDPIDEKVGHLLDMGLVQDAELARELLQAQNGDLDKVIDFLSSDA